ncbi:MAG: dihydrolipoyl dehydrogenase [Dehalococcoidales bacterium]|nr:dihydrolipoyl dehydrogenase [Dehalococcoidales bacterium]
MAETNVVVIGSGPGGYVAAIRAAQLGAKVTLVEKGELGGICLNRGCIPTKFLLHSADIYQSIKDAGQYGINVTGVSLDMTKMQSGKQRVISTLVSGVRGLLKGNGVDIISGRAKLVPSRQVEIDLGEGKSQTVQPDKIIIAAGSKPIVLPIPGGNSPDIMDASDMLNLSQLPESLALIGGGVIGVEMATILAKMGSKVNIVEMMPHCLPTQDAELSSVLEDAFKRDGVGIYCSSRVSRIEDTGSGKRVVFTDSNKVEKSLEVAAVAMSVGYKPNLDDLGLAECGVTVSRGGIKVSSGMETSIPGIYAIGDVVGGMMLAYVAMAEGIVAAENATGMSSQIDYTAVPQCIFTLPEVASVGLTEEVAIAQGHKIQVGRFPFSANGLARVLGEPRGLVKIITEEGGRLLGIHIVGPHATKLIAEAAIVMKLGGTNQDIIRTMHAHPTLSEALWEAAMDVDGKAIHYPPRRKSG